MTWEELERPGAQSVVVDGVELRAGARVRLHPRSGGDIFDTALRGKTAVVESIEEDMDGQAQLAVTVDDDPGRDLGLERMPGHRFFFTPEEVEPLAEPSVLVAGIGNVFLGDDGFGSELARLLAGRELPAGVTVRDFGIRAMDLAYSLGEGWDAVLLLDAVPRNQPPGTLSVIEPELDRDSVALDTHTMDPVKVLRLAEELGPLPGRTLVVGCEPASVDEGMELSEPVRAALASAARLVEQLLGGQVLQSSRGQVLQKPGPRKEAPR